MYFWIPLMLSTLLCIDTSLGKVDKSLLSQETLMELIIESIDTKSKIYGPFGTALEIGKWNGLTFNAANGISTITKIEWEQFGLKGSIHLQWIPQTVTYFTLWENLLCGSLDLTNLPPKLYMLSLHSNRFEGTIDLSNLPTSLHMLSLTNNQLHGTLDLTRLSEGIRRLFLNENAFEGRIDFEMLPKSLKLLDIRRTKFSGVTRRTASREVRADFSNVNILD